MFDSGMAWLRREIYHLRQNRQHSRALLKSIDEVVEITDPKIRLANRYRKTLVPSVEKAIQYCNDLVVSLPGPVRLHQKTYYDDPLVKALFRSVEELEALLQQARNAAAPDDDGQELFALLTMTKTETIIYGHKQQGEMLLSDVPMRAVTFIEHRVVAPASDLQATKTRLEQRSLEILASVAMEKIASLKLNLTELRQRRERLNAMHRILAGKRQTFDFFAQPEQANMQKINELKALLRETENEIELARKEIETPDDTLGHLNRIMALPAQTFTLRQQSLPLNWMNVLVEDSEDTAFHLINLAELSLNEELFRSAVLVRFDR
jgi:Mg2+ and Co2+ transporter CorA